MMQLSTPYGPPPAPTLLVLEETPFWFAELQRQLKTEAIGIRLRCRAEDAWELSSAGSVKMLVIGSDIELPSVLRLLTKLRAAVPVPRIAILLPPEWSDLEWSLRELGAVDILTAPFATRELVDVVRREFGSRTDCQSVPPARRLMESSE